MARLAILSARIARIERARQPRKFPKMLFALYDRESDVTGVSGPSGAIVDRMPNEPVSALSARAWAMFGGSSLWATYPQSVWDEPEVMPPEIADLGWSEPEQIQPDQADPFALAGIGRKATDEELAKMGITPRYR